MSPECAASSCALSREVEEEKEVVAVEEEKEEVAVEEEKEEEERV